MRRAAAVLAIAALALGACGGDSAKEQDALAEVCDARTDINRQIETLRGLTVADVRNDQARESLEAIGTDLRTIRAAQPELSDDRRQEIADANRRFTSELRGIASQFGTGIGRTGVEEQLRTAMDQLATTYRQTLAPVDCEEG